MIHMLSRLFETTKHCKRLVKNMTTHCQIVVFSLLKKCYQQEKNIK